jgi:hypothetical protein
VAEENEAPPPTTLPERQANVSTGFPSPMIDLTAYEDDIMPDPDADALFANLRA